MSILGGGCVCCKVVEVVFEVSSEWKHSYLMIKRQSIIQYSDS